MTIPSLSFQSFHLGNLKLFSLLHKSVAWKSRWGILIPFCHSKKSDFFFQFRFYTFGPVPQIFCHFCFHKLWNRSDFQIYCNISLFYFSFQQITIMYGLQKLIKSKARPNVNSIMENLFGLKREISSSIQGFQAYIHQIEFMSQDVYNCLKSLKKLQIYSDECKKIRMALL